MRKELIIGIAYHKEGNFYQQYPYLPIQVGAVFNKDLGIQKDSDGDNISKMNAYCSELSATYWIWKNCEAEYKGLFHYRRFMTFKKGCVFRRLPLLLFYYISKIAAVFIRDARCFYPMYSIFTIDEKDVINYLDEFADNIAKDISKHKYQCYSLGYMKYSTRTMETHLRLGIGGKHFEILGPIIKKDYPAFYKYFRQTLRSGKLIGYNMIIAQNDIYDQYCKLIFGILEKYHNYFIDNLQEDETNKALLRDSGYAGEIITDAFIRMIKANGIKCKNLNCIFVNTEPTGLSYKRKSLLSRILDMIKT